MPTSTRWSRAEDVRLLQRRPGLHRRLPRLPRHGRFRCMHTRIGTKREQIMFDLPVEVARASFDVRLMWAVEGPGPARSNGCDREEAPITPLPAPRAAVERHARSRTPFSIDKVPLARLSYAMRHTSVRRCLTMRNRRMSRGCQVALVAIGLGLVASAGLVARAPFTASSPLYPSAPASPASSPARSPRNANYEIDAHLDVRTHILTGAEVVTWRNITTHPTAELRLHLYHNAWESNATSFALANRFAPGSWSAVLASHGPGTGDTATSNRSRFCAAPAFRLACPRPPPLSSQTMATRPTARFCKCSCPGPFSRARRSCSVWSGNKKSRVRFNEPASSATFICSGNGSRNSVCSRPTDHGTATSLSRRSSTPTSASTMFGWTCPPGGSWARPDTGVHLYRIVTAQSRTRSTPRTCTTSDGPRLRIWKFTRNALRSQTCQRSISNCYCCRIIGP